MALAVFSIRENVVFITEEGANRGLLFYNNYCKISICPHPLIVVPIEIPVSHG
jgi:hypothetical protein